MARSLRIQGEGLTYHVTARGSGRMAIYRDDVDRRRFLALLGAIARRYGFACHAYCLMSNHYHLVLTTDHPNLSISMRQLNGVYAQRWNRRHGRVGHVFQGRYVAQLVQDGSYFLTVCRYVALNPVRAGLVASPEAWQWSSYRATAGLGAAPRLLHRTMLLAYFGDAPPEAAQRYREYVASESADAGQLSMQRILGDERFARSFAAPARAASPEVPRAERVAGDPLATIFENAATRTARASAMARAYRLGHSQHDIASHLGVHYSTVSRALAICRE